ncbi:hypothetical protein MKZ38_003478 [Zalerion maritima]|uniref:Uncharacterized protein n=1 Tax=Zalerion maritima TaxID=339359 RepID=A0AAD5RYD4_9PEZI|nr:hypothetical protein MKZ38_003478 [Zalerion maritima]
MDATLLPIPGDTLLSQELKALQNLAQRPALRTGCGEIDDYVLGNGFEPGTVVGVSTEDEEFGLTQLSLQTIAKSLLARQDSARDNVQVSLVTMLPTNSLLPALMIALKAQIAASGHEERDALPLMKAALNRIGISRVFDMEGMLEVLNEIESDASPPQPSEKQPILQAVVVKPDKGDEQAQKVLENAERYPVPQAEQHNKSSPTPEATAPPRPSLPCLRPVSTPAVSSRKVPKAVIEDSEDEEVFSRTPRTPVRLRNPSESSSLSPPPSRSPEPPRGFHISPETNTRAHKPMVESPMPESPATGSLVIGSPLVARPKPVPVEAAERLSHVLRRTKSPKEENSGPLSDPLPAIQSPSNLPEALPMEYPPKKRHYQAEHTTPQSQPSTPPPPSKPLPSIILITHASVLLSSHFTAHSGNRNQAHLAIDDISLRLRLLAQRGVLIMLLNSTSAPYVKNETSLRAESGRSGPPQPPPGAPPEWPGDSGTRKTGKDREDQTLTSIFPSPSPPPCPASVVRAGSRGLGEPTTAVVAKKKPSYGAVFSKLLHLHLLCTKVPRTAGDARLLQTPMGRGGGGARFAWVVEVLLDEVGVTRRIIKPKEGGGKGMAVEGTKRSERGTAAGRTLELEQEQEEKEEESCREQRWAAVDVLGGKIMDPVIY